MRARLNRYLPIFLFALLVQIVAPISVYRAAAVAATDPLSFAEICLSGGATADQSTDQGDQHNPHHNGCSLCCLAGASGSIDTPRLAALAAPSRVSTRVAWHDQTRDASIFRVGANAQARAPPFAS